MRICRFTHSRFDGPRFGAIVDTNVIPLAGFDFGTAIVPQDESGLPLAEVKLLAPVAPSKVVCVGRNYREHAAELGNKMPDEPLLFLKAPSALIGPEKAIQLPHASQQVEHEGELGVVIGRKATGVKDDPLSYVLGYTCVNDVTARDLQ